MSKILYIPNSVTLFLLLQKEQYLTVITKIEFGSTCNVLKPGTVFCYELGSSSLHTSLTSSFFLPNSLSLKTVVKKAISHTGIRQINNTKRRESWHIPPFSFKTLSADQQPENLRCPLCIVCGYTDIRKPKELITATAASNGKMSHDGSKHKYL